MKVVMDTSSLISPDVVDLVDLPFLDIYIPKEVEEELGEISKYEDREGKAASAILDRELNIIKVDREEIEKYLDRDVDEGEAACFALCKGEKILILLIDDIDASYALYSLTVGADIKLKMSFAVLSEMLGRDLINKEEAKEKIREMVKIRNWGGSALEYLAEKWLDKF